MVVLLGPIDAMPRVYLAWPAEIADRLRMAAEGRGDTILHERHAWGNRAHAAGIVDEVPQSGRISATQRSSRATSSHTTVRHQASGSPSFSADRRVAHPEKSPFPA